jgi:phosphopantothenate synthetase
MQPYNRRGRKKQFNVAGWVYLPIRLPKEVWRGLQIDCFYRDKKQAELIRELLEEHLQKGGILKVLNTKDSKGNSVRSYEVKEPPKP